MSPPNPMPPQRCGRRTRQGGRCTQWAMHGQTTCKMHGGLAAQNLLAARKRLLELVHPALGRVAYLIDHADSDAVRLATCKYVLEYAGFKVAEKIETDGQISIRIIREETPIMRMPAHNGHAKEGAPR